MKSRKAQSATEYLMTYGWAILAIAIVGALLYTQVFQTKKCAEGAVGFPITGAVAPDGNEYSISANTGIMQVSMKNTVGKQVTITNITLDDGTGTYNNQSAGGDIITDSNAFTLKFNMSGLSAISGKTSGDCYSHRIVVTYNTESNVPLVSSGTLNGKYR